MKLRDGLIGVVLSGVALIGGCRVNNHVYFGDPRWAISSWVVGGRYKVFKNGNTRVLTDEKTGEKYKRILGDFQRVDRRGRRIHGVERMYAPKGEEYMKVDCFPDGINTMMNGDQGIGDDFDEKLDEFRKKAARYGVGGYRT